MHFEPLQRAYKGKRQETIDVRREEKRTLLVRDPHSQLLCDPFDLSLRMMVYAAAPSRRTQREPDARTPGIGIKNDNAARRKDASNLTQEVSQVREMEDETKCDHRVEACIGKRERKRIGLSEGRRIPPTPLYKVG